MLFISGLAVLLTGLVSFWAVRSQLKMVFDREAMVAIRYTSQVLGMLRDRRSDKP